MIPKKITVTLPTGRPATMRADLSLRVMLRQGLVQSEDETTLIYALGDVAVDDRELGRRLQDALVMHALDVKDPGVLDGLTEEEFLDILDYAVRRLTTRPEEEDAEVEEEEVLGVTEPEEPSLEDELARVGSEVLPEVKVPASAEVLARMEAADGGE